ncbi:MAG: helix-turn-helix transcriptional regulator [Paracoccaceae bacterium]
MRRAERLFRLVNEMRARPVTRADDLARGLEVSPRTIYRDIAHLQASGLPIEGEAGVGYLLRPGFNLPSVTFTHEQLDALAIALSFAEGLDDPVLATAAREVRAKLQAGLPEPGARKLADAPYFSLHRRTGAPGHATLLRRAIRKRRIVEIAYQNAAGQSSTRRVRPLAIWTLPEGWMFCAWCDLRAAFRVFRLDRITSLTLTDEAYENDPTKDLRRFLELDRCEGASGP